MEHAMNFVISPAAKKQLAANNADNQTYHFKKSRVDFDLLKQWQSQAKDNLMAISSWAIDLKNKSFLAFLSREKEPTEIAKFPKTTYCFFYDNRSYEITVYVKSVDDDNNSIYKLDSIRRLSKYDTTIYDNDKFMEVLNSAFETVKQFGDIKTDIQLVYNSFKLVR